MAEQIGRPLTEAQRQHLTQLIANMQIAQAKLSAAQSILEAQREMAQKELDSAQAAANAFLRYCALEHRVTFDDGQWDFDQELMCFIHVLPKPPGDAQLEKIPQLNGGGPQDAEYSP